MKYKIGDIVTFSKRLYAGGDEDIHLNSVGPIKKIDPECHQKLIYQVDFKDYGITWVMEEEIICDLSIFKDLGD